MKIQKLMFLFVLAVSVSLAYSCGDDEGDETPVASCQTEVSYSGDIVPIVNQTCAIPNCHVSNFPFGDYTNYAGLEAQVAGDRLATQIETRAMPPQNSAGPTELTVEQLATFLCWIDQGALDN